MRSPLSVPLNDKLIEFVEQESGEGTQFPSPAEYVRDLIRREQEARDERDMRESREFCEAVIEGYKDILEGRTIEFKGSIKDVIRQMKERGWIDP